MHGNIQVQYFFTAAGWDTRKKKKRPPPPPPPEDESDSDAGKPRLVKIQSS